MKLVDLFSSQKFNDINERNALWRRMTPEERGRVLDAAMDSAESRIHQKRAERHDATKVTSLVGGQLAALTAMGGVMSAPINPALFMGLAATAAVGTLGGLSVEAYDAIQHRILDNKLSELEGLKSVREAIIHQPDLMALNGGHASFLGRQADRCLGQHWDSVPALESAAPDLAEGLRAERKGAEMNEMKGMADTSVAPAAASYGGRIEPHFGQSEELAAETPLTVAQYETVNEALTIPITQFMTASQAADKEMDSAHQILTQHRINSEEDIQAPESVRREAALAAECMANAKREKQRAMACMEAAHHASIEGNLASVTEMIEQAQTHLTQSATWTEQADLAVAAHRTLDDTAASMGYRPSSGGGFRDALKQLGTQLRHLVERVASIPDMITAAADKAEAGIYRTAQRFGEIGLSVAHTMRDQVVMGAGVLVSQVKDHATRERDALVADAQALVHRVQDSAQQMQEYLQTQAHAIKREVLLNPDVIEIRAAVNVVGQVGSLAVDEARIAVHTVSNVVTETAAFAVEKASDIIQKARGSVNHVAQAATSARDAARQAMRASREAIRTQTYLALEAAAERAHPGVHQDMPDAAFAAEVSRAARSHAPSPGA